MNPPFPEPWQAQALALADTLVRDGLFSAREWSETLGRALRAAEDGGAVDSQQTYYACVLEALERLVSRHSEIDSSALAAMRAAWEWAYRSTPHGHPVSLDESGNR